MMWETIIASLGDMSVRALVILIIAAVGVKLLARRPAHVKHVVWSTAMVGILLVPGLSTLMPAWHVDVLPERLTPVTTETVVKQSASVSVSREIDTEVTSAGSSTVDRIERDAKPVPLVSAQVPTTASRIDWPLVVFTVWLAGALLLLMSLVRGLRRAHGMRMRATVLDSDGWPALLAACSERIGIVRPAVLAQSDEVSAPMTWGFWRPIILVPANAHSWSDEKRRVVLLHELAHIKRNDWLAHIVSRLACIVYWFNPLVWVGANHMNIEREKACDDDVIATGTRPSAYAEHLLDIARSLSGPCRVPAATLTMARLNQLEGRLVSILSKRRSRGNRAGWLPALLLTPIIVALASFQPLGTGPDAQAVAEHGPGHSHGHSHAHASDHDHSDGHTHDSHRYHSHGKGYETDWSNGEFVSFQANLDDIDMFIRIDGEVRFNDDGDEITYMASDASVYLEATEGRTDFELEITKPHDEFEYDWRIDGRRAEFDEEAEAWMQAALPIAHDHYKIALVRGEANRLRGQINAMKGERNALRGKINALHGQRNALRGDMNALQGKRNALHGQINAIHGRRNGVHGEINAMLSTRNALEQQIEALYGERNSVRGRYEMLAERKQDLIREQRSLEREIRANGGEPSANDKEMHKLLEEKILDIDRAQAELEVMLDEGYYESREREIRDKLRTLDAEAHARQLETKADEMVERELERVREQMEQLNLEEQMAEAKRRADERQVDERVAEIEQQIKDLMVEEQAREVERRIEALDAKEIERELSKDLKRKYDRLEKQMRSMKK